MKRAMFVFLTLSVLLVPAAASACDGNNPLEMHGRPWVEVQEEDGTTTMDLMATVDVCWPGSYEVKVYAYSPWLYDEHPCGEIFLWSQLVTVKRTGHHQTQTHETFPTPSAPYVIEIVVGIEDGPATYPDWPFSSSCWTGGVLWVSPGYWTYQNE